MAIFLLLAVIGAIVYFARQARRACIVRISVDHPNRVLECNIRDMSAALVQLNPLQTLESHVLRRDEDGTWEQAVDADGETPDASRWRRCEASLESTLEHAYCQYNGIAEAADR